MFTDLNGGQHPLYIGTSYITQSGNNVSNSCNNGGSEAGTGGGDTQTQGVLPNSVNDPYNPSAQNSFPVKVYTPDGTVYTFSTEYGNTTIEDRNGNIATVLNNYNINNGNSSPTVQDTAGRTVVSYSWPAVAGVLQPVTVGGLTYNVMWTTVSAASGALPYSLNQEVTDGVVQCSANGIPPMNDTQSAIHSISLPNGQSYNFFYGTDVSSTHSQTFPNPYGLLNEIDYPSGAWVTYQWGTTSTYNELADFPGGVNTSSLDYCGDDVQYCVTASPNGCVYQYSTPVVVAREVGLTSNGAAVQTQTFSYSTNWGSSGTNSTAWTQKTTQVVTTDNVRGVSATTNYSYSPYPIPSNDPLSAPPVYPQQVPVEQQITYYDFGGTGLETVNKWWLNQYQLQSAQTIPVSVSASQVIYSYASSFPFSLDGEEDDYDYGASSPTRMKHTSYQSFSGTPGELVDRVSSVVVCSAGASCSSSSQNRVSETDYSYNGGSFSSVSGLPANTHDETNFSSGLTTPRGNVMQVTKQCWPSCLNSVTTYTYDETGQVRSMTDPKGNQTQYSFTDSPSGGNAAGNSNAYLTNITYPSVNGLTPQKSFAYNYATGNVTSSLDENKVPTTYCYLTGGCTGSGPDPFNRLTETDYYDGGRTTISYQDSVLSVLTTKLQTPNPTLATSSIMDGLGHVIQTQTSEANGTDVISTSYDGLGHVYTRTNPFLSSSLPSTSLVSTPAGTPVTTSLFDSLGRPIEVLEQDGSSLQQWCYDGGYSYPRVANCTAHAGSVTGTWVDATDENGNHWQRTSDSFGRLTEVMEPNGSSQSPSMETDYSYDPLNNLLSAMQHGQGGDSSRPRSFANNSLSQLVSSVNPESGSIGYTYDLNGNLQTRTDARGVVTNYAYDALNRLLSKTYASAPAGTLSSCYQYDTAVYGVGRLGSEWTQAGSCSSSPPSNYQSQRVYGAYDSMGRVLTEQQCVPGFCTSASVPSLPAANCPLLSNATGLQYCYDLAGNLTAYSNGLISSTFPQQWILLSQTFDAAGRLSSVSSLPSGSQTQVPLFSPNSTAGYEYTPFGALQSWNYGTALNAARIYDPRMRVTGETASTP
jgi:YD repeat-containing protein